MRLNAVRTLTPLFAAAALTVGVAHAQDDFPQRDASGKTLVVPAEHAAKGAVYYLVPGKPGPDADQTRFTNNPPDTKQAKPVDAFTGFSNEAVGYIVTSSGDPQNIIAGEFLLPVESMDTGIKGRNNHLKNKTWLDAKKHPDIRFSLAGVRNLRPAGTAGGAPSYTAELHGKMTLHGVTKDFAFPATIMVRPNEDLIAIRAQYPVTLADFDVANNIIGKKVAGEIVVEQFFILSPKKPS